VILISTLVVLTSIIPVSSIVPFTASISELETGSDRAKLENEIWAPITIIKKINIDQQVLFRPNVKWMETIDFSPFGIYFPVF
jgi:hypothetical protein